MEETFSQSMLFVGYACRVSRGLRGAETATRGRHTDTSSRADGPGCQRGLVPILGLPRLPPAAQQRRVSTPVAWCERVSPPPAPRPGPCTAERKPPFSCRGLTEQLTTAWSSDGPWHSVFWTVLVPSKELMGSFFSGTPPPNLFFPQPVNGSKWHLRSAGCSSPKPWGRL